MPMNDERLRQVLTEAVRSVEERVPGYPEEVEGAIVKMLNSERLHTIRPFRIQQAVDGICRDAARWLVSREDEQRDAIS